MADDPTRDAHLASAMRRAIELARAGIASGNYPLGAVVVDAGGAVVGEASSALVHGVDPSAHPEVVAMRQAADRLQSRYLPGCWLVSTLEPCPMCSSMAIWAKFAGVAFATSQPEAIAFGQSLDNPLFTFRQIRLRCAEVARHGTPLLDVREGLLAADGARLLEDFRGHVADPK